jgi:hypothetical protein
VNTLLKINKYSIADLADAFGMRSENLWFKLTEAKAAMERDLIIRSWLTNEPRRTYPVEALTDRPDMAKHPIATLNRGRHRPEGLGPQRYRRNPAHFPEIEQRG